MNKNKFEKLLSKTTRNMRRLLHLAKELTFPKNKPEGEIFPEVELIERIESAEYSNIEDAV